MRNRLLPNILFIALALFASSEALGWGAKAHLVIGMLAEERLAPATRAAVEAILAGDDLSSTTLWADQMRDSQTRRQFWNTYAASWHYVNITQGGDYDTTEQNPCGDAWLALQTFAAILLKEPVPAGPVREGLELYFDDFDPQSPQARKFALQFLVHIVGDLQQPLHSGFAEDRGGNRIELTWFGEPANPHSLWDTLLLERQNHSAVQIGRRLSARIARTPASTIRAIESADPLVWMKENRQLLKRLYPKRSDKNNLDEAYADEFVPTVEAQLVKGGLRTAWFLNQIFGWHGSR
jgi:hypothetical protein